MAVVRFFSARTRHGGLLVEVLVGLSLSVLFGIAIVTMGIGTLDSVSQSREQLQAVHYAAEGLEAVRAMSRQDFNALATGTHGVLYVGNEFLFSGTSDSYGQFTRTVTIQPAYRDEGNALLLNPADTGAILAAGGWYDSQVKIATSTVTWTTAGDDKRVSQQSLLTKWAVYPLQTHASGSGGTVHGTAWSASGATLARQPNFNPPIVLGEIDILGGETVADLLVDSPREYLYAITEEGTVLRYLLEEAGSGNLLLQSSVDLGSTLYSMTLRGEYLYIASGNNAAEVYVLNKNTLATEQSWNLADNADAVSIAMAVDDSSLFVGRASNANEEFYQVDPNPALGSPSVTQVAEVGSTVSFLEPYTTEWIFFTTTTATKELNLFKVSTAVITHCNMSGNQQVIVLDIQGDTILMGRANGPGGTIAIDSINPSTPENCSDYTASDWDNSGDDDVQDAVFDEYDQRVYALTDLTTTQFDYNSTSPSVVTHHTLETGSDCHTLAADGSLLYVACTNGGTDSLLVVDGAGEDRYPSVMSGTYIFPAVDAGLYAKVRAIYWSGTGGDVRFQIRTGTGSADLASSPWVGPYANAGLYYTVSGTGVTAMPDEGQRWAQVKAWLSRTGALSPSLDSVYLLFE